MARVNSCRSCRYFASWENDPERPDGSCVRHPPVVVLFGDCFESRWPKVDSDDWCGEWASRDPFVRAQS